MAKKSFVAVIAMVAAIVLMLPSTNVHAASYKTGIYKINTQSSDLNVRSCPSSQNMKVGSIPKGTQVNVTLISGSWGKVVYGSAHGWISLEYCKYIGPAEENDANDSGKNVTYGISASNLTWVVGCNQEYSKSSGLCTSSATGTMLRRRQAAEGKAVTFTFGDTRSSCGGDPNPDSKGYYKSCNFYYNPENGWIHVDETTGGKTVYYTVKEENKLHTHNREYIADLLDVHPEGVVVYANYGRSGKHAILISDYTRKADNTIQFYAYDPANHGVRLKLEQTWIMTKFKSVGGFFENVKSIWYIKGELTVDNSKFEHPEAAAFSSNMKVAKKNTIAYSEASTEAEKAGSLSKGMVVHVSHTFTDENGDAWYITDDDTYILASKLKVTELEVTKASVTGEGDAPATADEEAADEAVNSVDSVDSVDSETAETVEETVAKEAKEAVAEATEVTETVETVTE